MSQEVLAGLVGRTADWLSRVENNKIEIDRLSVLRKLADVLRVCSADILGEEIFSAFEIRHDSHLVVALREAILDHRLIAPSISVGEEAQLDPRAVRQHVGELFDAYQAARWGYLAARVPGVLGEAAQLVVASHEENCASAYGLLALGYQSAAAVLTKVGEPHLAWMVAERGLSAARSAASPVVLASLTRSVVHALLSAGQELAAMELTRSAGDLFQPDTRSGDRAMLSVYGSLFLAGSMAAARLADSSTVHDFLAEADEMATRLGQDANYLWTSFGPANVAVHRAATSLELGDIQTVLDLHQQVDISGLPVERRVRHVMGTAKAFSLRDRQDQALNMLLDAEQVAADQVRHHLMARQLVVSWIRQQRGNRNGRLSDLARRMHLV